MGIVHEDREQWARELLANLDPVSLTGGSTPPSLLGAEGPTSLALEPGEVVSDSPAVEYSFTAYDTHLDIVPGALIFHFRHTEVGPHGRLERVFQEASAETSLLVEALWFADTGSSQIALVDPERTQ